jgi:hypothetical protein
MKTFAFWISYLNKTKKGPNEFIAVESFYNQQVNRKMLNH